MTGLRPMSHRNASKSETDQLFNPSSSQCVFRDMSAQKPNPVKQSIGTRYFRLRTNSANGVGRETYRFNLDAIFSGYSFISVPRVTTEF
jgi:hypothetical protein